MPEREQLIEIGVSVSAVVVMLSAMLWVGTTYGGRNGVLQPDGAEILVYVIIGFIFLMTAVGIALAFLLNEPEDGLEGESDDEVEAQSTV